jgi:hypothetical protein
MQPNRIFSNSWPTIVWSIPRYCNRCWSGTLKSECRCRRNSNATCWKADLFAPNTITLVASCKYNKSILRFWLKSCSSERCALTGSNFPGCFQQIILPNRIFINSRTTIVWSDPRECNICCSGTLKRNSGGCKRNSHLSSRSLNCFTELAWTITVVREYLKRIICL